MESLGPLRDWFQRLFTLLLLASIVTNASTLNHHRDLRETLDPALEIAITDNEGETRSGSSDSVVIKAVDIPEESITYEGSQVWRVLADNEKAEYVSYLQEVGGLFLILLIILFLICYFSLNLNKHSQTESVRFYWFQ